MEEPSLLVVVPTRNRSELAMEAIRSVLSEGLRRLRLLVSDNSSDEDETSRLASFCDTLPGALVQYRRAPANLAMSAHWEWAAQLAWEEETSHVAYLTDRMVFRRGELAALMAIVGRHPDRVITFNHDRVVDDRVPVRLETQRSSGKLFEIDSEHLLSLSSRSVFHTALPRMLNTIVPRRVLSELRRGTGCLFDSASPDFYFAYRCLDVVPSILHYDSACLIHYALARSNGAAHAQGLPSKDSIDFDSRLGGEQPNHAAPVPALRTVPNAILHEYCLIRGLSGSTRFREPDLPGYLATNRQAVEEIVDPGLAAEMRDVLRVASTRLSAPRRWGMVVSDFRLPLWGRKTRLAFAHPFVTAELVAPRLIARLTRRPRENRQFPTAEEAIAYANQLPPRRTRYAVSLLPLLSPAGHVREVR